MSDEIGIYLNEQGRFAVHGSKPGEIDTGNGLVWADPNQWYHTLCPHCGPLTFTWSHVKVETSCEACGDLCLVEECEKPTQEQWVKAREAAYAICQARGKIDSSFASFWGES
jgi:hypothetical protein